MFFFRAQKILAKLDEKLNKLKNKNIYSKLPPIPPHSSPIPFRRQGFEVEQLFCERIGGGFAVAASQDLIN